MFAIKESDDCQSPSVVASDKVIVSPIQSEEAPVTGATLGLANDVTLYVIILEQP